MDNIISVGVYFFYKGKEFMAKFRWNRNCLNENNKTEIAFNKLTIALLLRVCTSSYKERINTYDRIDDDPVEDAYYAIKTYIEKKSNEVKKNNNLLINNKKLRSLFLESKNYENLEKKTIPKTEKEEILKIASNMILKHDCSLQVLKPTCLSVSITLTFLLLILGIGIFNKSLISTGKEFLYYFFVFAISIIDFLSALLFFVSKNLLKQNKSWPFYTLNQKLDKYNDFYWLETEIEDAIEYIENKDFKKIKIDYSSMTTEELVEEFKKHYSEIFEKYPHFFEILKKYEYKEQIILNDDNSLQKPEKCQKLLLTFINSKKNGKQNKLGLVYELFKPTYEYDRLKEHMNEPNENKIKDFTDFLERKENQFQLTAIQSK